MLTHVPGMETNRNIEHLRAFAILMVLCHHFTWMQPALPVVLWDAWSGVDLFFAISGYVIALSLSRSLVTLNDGMSTFERLAANRGPIRAFYIRRLWRILPPLLATLALAAVLTAALGVTTWKPLLVEIVASLSMTYNYVVYGGGPFLLDVLWSLAVEMQFYLLLPLFMVAFTSSRQRLLAAIGVFLLIGAIVRPAHIYLYTIESDDWLSIRFSTHCRLDTLAAGVAVYALSNWVNVIQGLRALSAFAVRGISFACIMVVVLIPGTSVEFSHNEGFSLLALAAGGAVLVAVGSKIPIIPPGRASSVLRYVGERSFSLYLVHRLATAAFVSAYPTVVGETHVMGNYGLMMRGIMSASILALTFILAEIMYRCVEIPGMEAGRRFGSRPRSNPNPGQICAENA